jgi:hypothetical protein
MFGPAGAGGGAGGARFDPAMMQQLLGMGAGAGGAAAGGMPDSSGTGYPFGGFGGDFKTPSPSLRLLLSPSFVGWIERKICLHNEEVTWAAVFGFNIGRSRDGREYRMIASTIGYLCAAHWRARVTTMSKGRSSR